MKLKFYQPMLTAVAVAMTALAGWSTAGAQTTDTEPVPFSLLSTDPAQNEIVESLKTIKTEWGGPVEEGNFFRTYNSNKSQISVTNEAGEVITDGRMSGSSANGTTVTLTKKLTEEGTYTVTIAPNTIYLGDFNNMDNMGRGAMVEGTGNAEIVLHFTVGTPVTPFSLLSTDPSQDEMVESLKTIKTVWGGPVEEGNFYRSYNQSKTQITVTDEAGEVITDGRMTGSEANGVTITLSKKLTDPGKYTVTIAPNTIFLGDFDKMDNMGKPEMVPGTGNAEIALHFTVGVPVVPFTLVSTDPSQEDIVESLKTIKTVWTGEEVTGNLYPSYNTNKTQISVTDEAGEVITNGRMTGSDANGVTITLTKKLTDHGKYTITIAPNTIFLGNFDKMDNMGKPEMVEGTGNLETVLHFTVGTPVTPFTLVSTDPSQDEMVESLKTIKTVWSGEEEAGNLHRSYNTAKTQISVTDEAGAVVTDGRMTGSEANGVTITLSKKLTDSGKYTITIAPNTIFLGDFDKMDNMGKPEMVEGTGNRETVLHFTVGVPAIPFALISTDPAQDDIVESLKTIKTEWAGPVEEGNLYRSYNTNKTQITVTDEAGEVITDGRMTGSQANGVTVTLTKKLTDPGKYTITIAPNTIFLGNFDKMDNNGKPEMVEGTGNAETVLHFTVGTPVVRYALISTDPAQDAVLESLKTISMEWSGPVTEGDLQTSCNSAKTQISVTDASGAVVTDGRMTSSEDNGVTISLTKKIIEKGEYTITIAPNTIFLGDFSKVTNGKPEMIEGTGNRETTLHYVVDPDAVGVEGILDESEEAVYYDLNGNRVENPAEGFYIKVTGNKAERVRI